MSLARGEPPFLPQLLGGQPVSLEAEGRELRPLWGRPREKGHKWRLLFPPQVQATEVVSDDQDNPDVFYTVERDESGEVVCLCSDMGEAYDKIGGSPHEGQWLEGASEQTRCPPLGHSPGPKKAEGELVGQPRRGWSTKANNPPPLLEEQLMGNGARLQSGQQLHPTQEPNCPKGTPGMPS